MHKYMITEHDQQRIDQIQSEVNFYRNAFNDLLALLKDKGARERIQLALYFVNDIEAFFLNSARHDSRPLPGQLAQWLDYTEMTLHLFTIPQVEQVRKFYVEAIQKYGAAILETRRVA